MQQRWNPQKDFWFAANNSLDISKIGYVAFNTDAHKIFELQSCSDTAQANALKNTMRTETGKIINASGYNEDHSRFTNIEAGLAMAADMLNDCSNKNKFMIFLAMDSLQLILAVGIADTTLMTPQERDFMTVS